MDTHIDTAETIQIQDNDNTELIGSKVMNRATQTIGGDNQFILELRDQEINKEESILKNLESEMDRIKFLRTSYGNMKSGKVSRKFDVLRMIYGAYKNKDQKEGDRSIFNRSQHPYKPFDSLESLTDTLPKNLLKLLHVFIQRHGLILPNYIPSYCKRNNYFIANEKQFLGPFGDLDDRDKLKVELIQNDNY